MEPVFWVLIKLFNIIPLWLAFPTPRPCARDTKIGRQALVLKSMNQHGERDSEQMVHVQSGSVIVKAQSISEHGQGREQPCLGLLGGSLWRRELGN